jgi:serine/threonine protein kinase
MDIDIELQSQNWKQHFKQSIDSHQSKGNKTGEVLEIDISSIKTLDKIKTRYESDFKELGLIGDGGFGKVFKVINSLDLQQYAIKIINLKGNSPNLSFMF